MNEYYDDLSAKRVLHDADENNLKFKGENQNDDFLESTETEKEMETDRLKNWKEAGAGSSLQS
jgi:hypothetical protein